MLDANYDDHVFRFIQLRPPKTITGEVEHARPDNATTETLTPSLSVRKPDTKQHERLKRLVDAQAVLMQFGDSSDFRLPQKDGEEAIPLMLSESAVSRLPGDVQKGLKSENLYPDSTPYIELMSQIEALIANLARKLSISRSFSDTPMPVPEEERPYIKSSGIADLLVVKQQIQRYEASEIAHIENILPKETKKRSHRRLDREEQIFFAAEENTVEKETELQTVDRFELNRESTKTMQRDREIGFGLSVSGKYGPTVEFTSNLEASQATSESSVISSATSYARDVTERSRERIISSIREERTRTLVREVEEINKHEIANDDISSIVGMYQFVDKIYVSQVFNYGLRQMFDFMIPEPASYLRYLRTLDDKSIKAPNPPVPLENDAPNASAINNANYLMLGARYHVNGLKEPPPLFVVNRTSLSHGTEGDSEEGQPRSRTSIDMDIPSGYKPLWAFASIIALTDDDPTVSVIVGEANTVWQPSTNEVVNVGSGHDMARSNLLFLDVGSAPNPQTETAKLPLHAVAFETTTFVVNLKIVYRRLDDYYRDWQIDTYEKIAAAYQDRLAEHRQLVETLEAEARTDEEFELQFGSPPSVNEKIIREELKKHCLSAIRRERFDEFDATQDADPPYFEFIEAETEGSQIRFFEHAFEWDQMQYVLYPYFWARKKTWDDRFLEEHPDHKFLEFLKAGSARVSVPVRPGFEVAVSHFLETGNLWNGNTEEPEIGDPMYFAIVDEIRERTGGDKGEQPVGDPWETRIPTSLILLRDGETLPEWERVSENEWHWHPITDSQ